MHIRFDLALERLRDLVSALPSSAPGARRLRTLATRLATTSAATAWVDELIAQFGEGIDRLARCRNAAAHGGPAERGIIASVREFANHEAARTINLGVWATVKRRRSPPGTTTYERTVWRGAENSREGSQCP